jgi:hypothetical protein
MYVFPAKSVPNLNVQVEIYLLYLLQPVFALAFARLLVRERRRPYFWPLALVAVTKVVLGPAGRAAQGAGRSAPAWCRCGGVGHHVLQHPQPNRTQPVLREGVLGFRAWVPSLGGPQIHLDGGVGGVPRMSTAPKSRAER